MKRILIFLLVLSLALVGLVACTGTDDDNSDQGGSGENNQGGSGDAGGSDGEDLGGSTDGNGGSEDNGQGGTAETTAYTVNFKNNDGWTAVNVYVWLTDSESGENTLYTESWPGSAMTEGEGGWYSYSFEAASAEGIKLIFNNGTNQTGDLLFSAEKIWWANGVAFETKAAAEESRLDSITLYYHNTTGWEAPHFHAWNSTGAVNTWPGVPMTAVEGKTDWYCVEFSVASFEGLGYLFCDGTGEGSAATGNQTADVTYTADKLYYSNGHLFTSFEEAESDNTTYADLYIRGSHNSWGTDSPFVLNADGSKTITVELSAGVQFKISNNDWTEQIDYTNEAFQSNSNFDWGTDNNNIKVVNAGSYTFSIDADGNLTITKN